MQTHTYLNQNFFNTQRNKHKTIEEVDAGANWVRMKTEDGKLLKIFHNLDDSKKITERLEWLHKIGLNSNLQDVLAFPSALLTGLKRSEVGYVCEITGQCNLQYYIRPGKGEKLFKWYYDKTGGIDYRLKIAYRIASTMQEVHSNGYCLVDICPINTTLQTFDSEKPKQPVIQFTGIDGMSSYTYHPQSSGYSTYCDPLVYLNRTGASTSSDTYSFAVMLFEMLTTCHPFIGEDTEEMTTEELLIAINSGKLDYIGDENSDKNNCEDFEDTKIFLPQDLAILFNKMFTYGKFDASIRPTLADFKAAIIQELKKIVKCDHTGCEREYPYNKNAVCPFCNHKTKRVITARVKKVISASESMLLPYDGKEGFTSLPEIEEEVNFMVIREGLNKMTRSFFEPEAKTEKGGIGIFLQYAPEKKKIAIRNRFTKFKIKVCGKELFPYNKADKGQYSYIEFADDKEIIIELPNNAQIEPEEIVEVKAEEYGIICHKWIITIR